MISKVLKDLREDSDLSQVELAKKTGIAQTSLSMYESGIRVPTFDNLQVLADFYKVSLDYLTGRSGFNNVEIVDMPETVKIPVLGRVPAGIPAEAIQYTGDDVEMVDIPKEWTKGGKEFFGLLVKGDSMEPEYLAGDIVIVEITSEFVNGDDVVAYVNGFDATLKRIKKTGSFITLRPLNPKYSPMTYGAGDDPVTVIGVVREMRRRK